MSTYIVWNIQNTGCDTYAELVELQRDGYAHSSVITTDDIEGVIDAVVYEANATLGYALWITPTQLITEYIS